MTLPNLFVPGAAKSATSSLHEYLAQHPQVFMSRAKEPHFFSNDANFGPDKQTALQEYMNLFLEGSEGPIRGESSTGYMVFPHVIERIREHIENPKFIFIFRNPIERAYSHYWWIRGRGFEKRSFRKALLTDMDDMPDPQKRVIGFGGYAYYYAFGQYATYLLPFIETFGRERILITTTEQLSAGVQETMKLCFEFLGVSASVTVNPLRVNKTEVYKYPSIYRSTVTVGSQTSLALLFREYLPDEWFKQIATARASLAKYLGGKMKTKQRYPPMPQEERVWLASLYQEEVHHLRQITGLTFDEWNDDFPSDQHF